MGCKNSAPPSATRKRESQSLSPATTAFRSAPPPVEVSTPRLSSQTSSPLYFPEVDKQFEPHSLGNTPDCGRVPLPRSSSGSSSGVGPWDSSSYEGPLPPLLVRVVFSRCQSLIDTPEFSCTGSNPSLVAGATSVAAANRMTPIHSCASPTNDVLHAGNPLGGPPLPLVGSQAGGGSSLSLFPDVPLLHPDGSSYTIDDDTSDLHGPHSPGSIIPTHRRVRGNGYAIATTPVSLHRCESTAYLCDQPEDPLFWMAFVPQSAGE